MEKKRVGDNRGKDNGAINKERKIGRMEAGSMQKNNRRRVRKNVVKKQE